MSNLHASNEPVGRLPMPLVKVLLVLAGAAGVMLWGLTGPALADDDCEVDTYTQFQEALDDPDCTEDGIREIEVTGDFPDGSSSEELEYTDDDDLRISGSTSTELDADGEHRILDASGSDGNLYVNGLTWTNGEAGSGEDGGAILADHVTVTIEGETTFDGNRAENGGAIGGSSASVIVDAEDSPVTFTGNTTSNTTSGDGFGGAIAMSTVEINSDGTQFTGNGSDGGGAINAGNVEVNADAVFENNDAEAEDLGGGAIRAGEIEINEDGASFSGNDAAGEGGAIRSGGSVNIEGADFKGNTAGDEGGAIYATDDVTIDAAALFDDNTAEGGGAIRAQGTVTITYEGDDDDHVAFTDNQATDGNGGAVLAFDVEVGGAYAEFSANDAIGHSGVAGQGGAISATNVTVTGTHADFSSNTAEELGGALRGQDDIEVTGDDAFFYDNKVEDGEDSNGGALSAASSVDVDSDRAVFEENEADGDGGVLSVGQIGSVDIRGEGVTFDDNRAGGDGGAINGGDDAEVSIIGEDVAFDDNRADGNAGAISADQVRISGERAVFETNRTDGSGGAIRTEVGGTVDIDADDVAFLNNAAEGAGGALHNRGVFTIDGDGVRLAGNAAGSSGGAVWVTDTIRILRDDATFEGNTAGSGGGAIMLSGAAAALEIDGESTVFAENEGQDAAVAGATSTIDAAGAVFVEDGMSQVIDNTDGDLELSDTVIAGADGVDGCSESADPASGNLVADDTCGAEFAADEIYDLQAERSSDEVALSWSTEDLDVSERANLELEAEVDGDTESVDSLEEQEIVFDDIDAGIVTMDVTVTLTADDADGEATMLEQEVDIVTPATPAPPADDDDELVTVNLAECAERFTDVQVDGVHATNICVLEALGIVEGLPDGRFGVGDPIERGQFATVLAGILDLETDGTPPFGDVADDQAHAGAIAALADEGLISGFADGTFRPSGQLTRGQVASILAGALELEADGPVAFEDVDDGQAHAGAIAALWEAGLISGFADGTFRPTAELTRGQLATIVVNGFDLLEQVEIDDGS